MTTTPLRLFACAASALLLSLSATSAQAPPPPAQPAAPDAAALERKVEALMAGHVKANDFSGTILLAKDGKPLVAKGYGYANLEWQIPNTPTRSSASAR